MNRSETDEELEDDGYIIETRSQSSAEAERKLLLFSKYENE